MRWFSSAAIIATGMMLGLGTVGGAHAAPQPAGESAPDNKAEARRLFDQGKKDFQAKKFAEALAAFQESYRLVQSPNSHLWIVYSLTELGRVAESYNEAQLLVQEAEEAASKNPKYAPTAQAAKDEQLRVRGKIGLLTVQVDTSTIPLEQTEQLTLTVGGQTIAREKWSEPVPVPPGPVEVVLAGPGGSSRQTADVPAGGDASVSIAPAAEAPPPPPVAPALEAEEGESEPVDLMIPALVAGGVGVVGLALFGVFGGMTLSEYGSLEDECGDTGCPPSRSSEADDGRTYQTVANISLVVGIVGVAAGATLLIVDLTQGGSSADTAEPEPASAPTAEMAFGPGSVMVRGTF